MYDDQTTRIDCEKFEVLLADALDGRLEASQIELFDAHLELCPRCAPMFGESKLGQSWLQTLKSDEVAVPDFVVENILRETIGTVHQRVELEKQKSWLDRLKEVKWLQPVTATVLQPRFAMSFGMAFFSITMLLNVMGVKVSSIKNVDLRPSSISKAYHDTTARVVKYYENIRWVYEIESRVNDLKNATQTDSNQNDGQPKQEKTKPENKTTS